MCEQSKTDSPTESTGKDHHGVRCLPARDGPDHRPAWAGTVPWRKPWTAGEGVQKNFNSDRAYRGLNQLILAMSPFSSPFWMTAKGVKRAGGTLKESEFYKNGGRGATVVLLWKPIKKKERNPDTGQVEERMIMFLRSYNVWNLDQCDGITVEDAGATPDADPIDPIDAAEAVWEEYEGRPSLGDGGGAAWYAPGQDRIGMPDRQTFSSSEEYYSTLFHEMVHATGHESRLARKGIMDAIRFGSGNYSDEELVAEMGAAFLCAEVGISNERTMENSAAYIANWLKKLRDDKKLVVYAGARAQKAADMIRGRKPEQKSEDE